jgi:protein-tyrosine-phosphatase
VTTPSDEARDHIVFLCTGNAARSVMATVMLRDRSPAFRVTGAGTHVIEGHPMSVRTRRALERHGLVDHTHRSRQMWREDATSATLVVAMAPEHVKWVRENQPGAAARTATIKRLVQLLPTAQGASLAERVQSLALDTIELEDWEEVVDPASGEQPVFDDCADELDVLVTALLAALHVDDPELVITDGGDYQS